MKSAVVAWALFCLVLIPPSAFLGTVAIALGNEQISHDRAKAFEDRIEAAIRLRSAIDTASANGGEALAALPQKATVAEVWTAIAAATSSQPFGIAFTYQNGVVEVLGADEAAKEEARRSIANDPILRTFANGHSALFSKSGITFSSSDLNVLNVKRLESGLEVGWLVDASTILRGAEKTLPPEYVLVRDPEDNSLSTSMSSFEAPSGVPVPKGSLVRIVTKTAPPTLPPPRTKDALTGIQIGKSLRFHVVERDPEGNMWRAKRAKTRILVLAFGCITLFIAVAAAFFKRARNAQRLADLRTDFVAAVSHELRTPLASVRMFAELLEAGDVPEDERAEVEQALAGETRRLHATLDRMLRYGALARGKLVIAKQMQPLAPIAKEAAGKRDVTLDVPDDLDANVDGGMLTLALENLLSNAAKYAPEGGPYVVRAREDGDDVVVSVSDRGPGLSKAAQKKVFLPFERADQRLSKATEGSGVGLALVRGIARAHGGDASVTSEPGQGATFRLRLPRR